MRSNANNRTGKSVNLKSSLTGMIGPKISSAAEAEETYCVSPGKRSTVGATNRSDASAAPPVAAASQD